MIDYFKPRRRKIGLVTLALACVFAAGWVRSQRSVDSLTVAFGATTWEARSTDGVLELMRHRRFGTEPILLFDLEKTRWKSYPIRRKLPVKSTVRSRGVDFRHWIYQRKAKFGLVTVASGQAAFYPNNPEYGSRVETHLIATEFLYVVIPLTTLSAWLLLSRPRVAKSVQPASETI